MTPKLVEPGNDARDAERVVDLITRYAVRFDPVDRITFYSGIVRGLAPIRAELQAQIARRRPPRELNESCVAAKFKCPTLCKVEMSVVVVRCVMWESMYSVDFQGLWEGWDSFIVPRFPSGRHFHRF
jgi:hypothetical protein